MTTLIFIRHGIAEDSVWMRAHSKEDHERPLTEDGRKEVQKVAQGIVKKVGKIDMILSSPLVRAQQTAAEFAVAAGIDSESIVTVNELSPDEFASETLNALAEYSGVVACVGHQPNISSTATLALSGSTHAIIDMGRASVAGIEFYSGVRPGGGTLKFFTPRKFFL